MWAKPRCAGQQHVGEAIGVDNAVTPSPLSPPSPHRRGDNPRGALTVKLADTDVRKFPRSPPTFAAKGGGNRKVGVDRCNQWNFVGVRAHSLASVQKYGALTSAIQNYTKLHLAKPKVQGARERELAEKEAPSEKKKATLRNSDVECATARKKTSMAQMLVEATELLK